MGWRQLADLPWIKTPDDSIHSRLLSHCFQKHNAVPNVVARVDLEPTMLDLVKSGVALSLARDSIALRASHAGGVAVVDEIAVEAELAFICKSGRAKEPLVQTAMALMQEDWGS